MCIGSSRKQSPDSGESFLSDETFFYSHVCSDGQDTMERPWAEVSVKFSWELDLEKYTWKKSFFLGKVMFAPITL